MKILVTGYKPFLGASSNPSEYLANKISEEIFQVKSLILPVEFGRSFEILKNELEVNNYTMLIMIGQAAGRKKISLEKVALNWVQTENRDEAQYLPETGNISREAPLALMTKFPVDLVFNALKSNNYPVEISFSAGTYVCNELYFRVLEKFTDLQSVFVHVPLESDLQLETQLDILKKIISLPQSER